MQALLIGIDPPEEVKDEINKLKKKVIDTCGYQQQVNEPPHCTFVVNDFTCIDDVDKYLKEIVGNFSQFDIDVNGISYFPPEQSGTYMTYAVIARNKELQELQERIVADTSQFNEGCLLKEYLQKNIPAYRFTAEELANIKRYGYPYVGQNWIPHISVAILAPDAYKKVGEELEKAKFQYTFPLEEITLFVHKDEWQPFKTYRIGD